MRRLTIFASLLLIAAVADAQEPAAQQDPYEPLTHSERFHTYVQKTFSVESLLRAAAGSAVLQATDTPAEWGQGTAGYARRYGNSFAQHIMRQTIMYGAGDILHEDNTWRPSGRTGTGSRFAYALESSFLARKDDGKRRFSYSRLGSYVAVGFISREWQPHSTNGAQNALHSIETTVGAEVGFNVVREFVPKLFPHR